MPDQLVKRCFGVGCAKSATHALAAIGGDRAAHEPDAQAMLRLVLAHEYGEIDGTAFAALLRAMIDRRALALDVSQINGVAVETLVALYPQARYILTIRDAHGWLRSFVNHQLTIANAPGSAWPAFRELRFARPAVPYCREDQLLEAHGLYSVDAYLGYWRRHNAQVLATVPRVQLLVIPTARLDASLPAIAAFLDWPELAAQPRVPRVFPGSYVPSPLGRLDPRWLDERIAAHTAALVAEAGDRLDPDVSATLLR